MARSHLIDFVASATAHRDRDDLDVAIVYLLVEFLHARFAAIYRLVDDGDAVRVARRVAVDREQGELGREDIGELSELPTLNDVSAWRECVLERRVKEYVTANGHPRGVFPIESEQHIVGMLEFEPRRALRSRETTLISGILRIVKNHLALLDYGECDTLTRLLNRKTFEASFGKLRERTATNAMLNGDPSWLGVVDIDKFKSVNDTYGHLFGDEVLLLVAGLMKQNFRGADQLFRFGGEEFVVILDRANEAGAKIAFERLRAGIEAHKFPQIGRVTISLGYTRIDSQDASTTCVERADAALYYAKHHGRNNVRSYEALIAAGEIAPPEKKKDDIELF